MGYPLFIARRYLMAQRKQAIIYIISLTSVLGVIVGVASLVVVLALMTGFQEKIRSKILGANAHLTLLSGWAGRPVDDWERAVGRVRGLRQIVAAAPVVFEKGMAISQFNRAGVAVMIKGIDVVASRMVSEIAAQVDTDIGQLASAGERGRDRAILGKDLALGLGVSRGDVIRIIIAQANISPLLVVPRSREFEVVGIADAGFYDYDSTRVYLSLETAQRFIGLSPWQASAIEARIEREDRIQEVASEIQEELGDEFYVNDLVRMNRTFFSALRLEKLAMSIAIGLIILVAALNIVSVLVLMVMEKVRDIGVLSAMGATSAGIRRVFLLQGLIIASLGTLVGAGLGVALAWVLDHNRLITLPADVYFIPYVPFHVRPLDVLGVIVLTIAVAFLATLYPSWRASRLDPSEALRYE
ncbi:MAG TPA: FtsX-like permease family protein [Candidatus Polarisedimenticolia bacterium]|nr:FtsX-like permease family protein [Candidatus Polarisedimenticolia bacterium]